jgi:HEAT repeat protein
MLEMLLAFALSAPLQIGHYIPPPPDPNVPPEVQGIVAQPGLGPQLPFDPSRWEWWFDFNQEPLLALRARMPDRAHMAGASFEPVTQDDVLSVILPALVDALRDRPASGVVPQYVHPRLATRDVRAAAVMSLGRLQRAEAVPYIELVLEGDPDLFVRAEAVLALGFSGSPQAVETLVRIFRDEKQGEAMRTYAAAGLGLVANAQALDVIRAALSEKALDGVNNQLRAGVLYAAGVAADTTLDAPLRALTESHLFGGKADTRSLAAFALGRCGEPASRPALRKLLVDPDNQVRRSAAAAFESLKGGWAPEDVTAVLERASEENDGLARQVIARALGRSHSPEGRAWLRTELEAGKSGDRPHVALGLALDGDAGNAAPLLARLADVHESSFLGAIAVALGLLGSTDAVDPLSQRLAQERDPLLLSNLCLAVGLLDARSAETSARLDELARKSPDVEVVRSAIIGLGLLGDRARIAALAADIGTIKGVVHRAAVLHGLGLVGDRTIITPLLAVVRNDEEQPYVRTYALQALGELADPRPVSPFSRLSADVELNLDAGFLFDLYTLL